MSDPNAAQASPNPSAPGESRWRRFRRSGWTLYTRAASLRSYQSFSTIPWADGGTPVTTEACPGPVEVQAYGRWQSPNQTPSRFSRSNPSGPKADAQRAR